MSKKSKDNGFKFTPAVLIRLAIFTIITYFLFAYLGQAASHKKNNNPAVLGQTVDLQPAAGALNGFFAGLYSKLPEGSRKTLENLDSNPVIMSVQNAYKSVVTEINGFPGRQLNEIKKGIIQRLYESAMEQ